MKRSADYLRNARRFYLSQINPDVVIYALCDPRRPHQLGHGQVALAMRDPAMQFTEQAWDHAVLFHINETYDQSGRHVSLRKYRT
jgi:hypothetical protein